MRHESADRAGRIGAVDGRNSFIKPPTTLCPSRPLHLEEYAEELICGPIRMYQFVN